MPQYVAGPRLDYIFTPCASIFANRVCIYTKVERYSKKAGNAYVPPSSSRRVPARSSTLSLSAQRNIRDVVSLLVAVSSKKRVYDSDLKRHVSFRVNLLTLTLSSTQRHTDSEIVKLLLEPFLRQLRIKYPGLLYFWKAETQDNGNLHFHVTTNKFINLFALRHAWNKCQARLGYCAFQDIRHRNSTDVHAVKKEKELAAYLCKYVAKKDLYAAPLRRYFSVYKKNIKNYTGDSYKLPRNYFKYIKRKVTCKLWDCSKLLKQRRCQIEDIDSVVSSELNLIKSFSNTVVTTDYVTIIPSRPTIYYKTKVIKKLWFDFTAELRKCDSL